jgi:hypothetical protein
LRNPCSSIGFGVATIHPSQLRERSLQISHCASTRSCFRHLGAEFGSGEVDFSLEVEFLHSGHTLERLGSIVIGRGRFL